MKSIKKMNKAELAETIDAMYEMLSLVMPEYLECGGDVTDMVIDYEDYRTVRNNRPSAGIDGFDVDTYRAVTDNLATMLTDCRNYDAHNAITVETAREMGAVTIWECTYTQYREDYEQLESEGVEVSIC